MKKNSFVEGAVIATVAVVITKVLGMLYVIPFYKIIGAKGGALYSYAYNIYNIFLGISSAGIPTALSKIISEYDTLNYKEAKTRTLKIGYKIIGYLSIIAFLIMFIFAGTIAKTILGDLKGGNTYEDVAFVIRTISIAILVIPYLSISKGYIQGHKIITPTSIGSVLEQVVRIFIILFGSFITYKVLHTSLTLSVGVAVSGAFFGGLVAFLYLQNIMKKNSDLLGLRKYETIDPIPSKEIIKKIITYCIPFIIINIGTSIYSFTDMILILRGLSILGFSATDAEFIQSAITTWSIKISMIISAFAMGMSVSLIPNIVSAAVKKDWKDINSKMNKAYQIILIISIPCCIGLMILSKPVWTIFYGVSYYGPIILSLSVVSAVFSNLYNITLNTMQGLNKFKLVYMSVFTGFFVNALLDIPYMFLLNRLGLPAYLGTIFATITGYTISIFIAVRNIKKEYKMSFKPTFNMLLKIISISLLMAAILVILNRIINVSTYTSISSIIIVLINAIVGGLIYISLGMKARILEDVFGKEFVNRIFKKLTRKSK